MKMNGSYYKRKYSYSNKKNYAILILFITLFFGVGYAYLNTLLTINGTATVHKNTWDVHFENITKVDGSVDATIEATITDDTAVDFTVDLTLPGDVYSFTVDVVNDGTIDAMLSEVLKTGLTTEQEAYVEYTVTYSDGEEIIAKDALPSGDQDQLLVSVKYKDDITANDLPSEDQSIVLNLSTDYIQDDGTSTDRRPPVPPRYLYDKIIAQNRENELMVLDNQVSTYVSASTGIDFNVAPSDTNGKGVYVRNGTENDTYPVYYYRGEVTNNNVIFGGFCWKIVRTTETGGIKLIYNGTPTDDTCNNTGEASQIGTSAFNTNYNYNAYVGYMYGTPNSNTYDAEHLSTKESTSSTIKTYIDEWYSQNMTSYTSYLEDTAWCNDRSLANFSWGNGTGAGISDTDYGAYGRNRINPTPSLECVNQNDRFTVNETMEGRENGNAALTYSIALLTADELTLAGNRYTSSYSEINTYLTTGQFWWSLSPYYFDGSYASEFYVRPTGYMDHTSVDNDTFGVRPSVSLLHSTQISENGDGSVNSPFIVVTE